MTCQNMCYEFLPFSALTLQMFMGTHSTWKFSFHACAELLLLMGESDFSPPLKKERNSLGGELRVVFFCLKLVLSYQLALFRGH